MNPWLGAPPAEGRALLARRLPPTFIAREALLPRAFDGRAVMVVGPRQAGKSTFVWHNLERHFPDVVLLNAEDVLIREACSSAAELGEELRQRYPMAKAVFLEEAQHLLEAGLLAKGLVDLKLGLEVWITGSSSFHLHARTRESLAGRAVRLKVLPFSLPELLAHRAPESALARDASVDAIVARQLIFGSYPAAWLAPDDDERRSRLAEQVTALVLRDASDVYHIRNAAAFRRVLGLAALQMGNLVNHADLAVAAGVDSVTVDSYLGILEDAHILARLRPYAAGKRREYTLRPKLCFVDNGLRNALRNDFAPELRTRLDGGALLENWAFSEVTKRVGLLDNVAYWRSTNGAEVDLVIEHAGEVAGLEVKLEALRRPEVTRSSRSFIDAYHPPRFAVLNLALQDQEASLGPTRVTHVTPRTLHAWLDAVLGRPER